MARRRAVTILDIARAAGVSRTTASAALGGAGRISDATREHVRAVAAGLGYVANPAARHLRAGRQGAIGLYVPPNLFGYGFYTQFVFGAAEASRRDAYALTLIAPADGEVPAVAVAHVDGVIVVDPVVGDPVIRQLLASGLPVVAAERHLDPGPQPVVTIETEYGEAQRELFDHVWERGARAPVLLSVPVEFSWKRLVEAQYRDWCREREIVPRIRPLELGPDPEAVRDQVRELLAEQEQIDAVVAVPDGTALGALSGARDAGRSVGEDLLLASCIDSVGLRFTTPAITAIVAPPREIGRDAGRVLMDVLRGEDVPATIRRPKPELAIREST